jgi:transcriptional regulator with XRE-family HTH domain
MSEHLSVGSWLRRERERRGVSLRTIAEETKVSFPLLEGLEADDISRWPGGIFRRAFVRAYADSLGLDSEDVLARFEEQHADRQAEESGPGSSGPAAPAQPEPAGGLQDRGRRLGDSARLLGIAADLTVALVVGLGAAAAGSRLLWPVLFIALYNALGVLFTGTTPMVALLREPARPLRAPAPTAELEPIGLARPSADRRHAARRSAARPARQHRGLRRVQ